MKRNIQLRMAILISGLMMGFAAMAQGPDPLEDDPGTPIDGGVSILIAAGVGYGAKKMHDARKKNRKDQ